MTKKIRIGVSAMIAFALMFATSVNVVAQEKVVISDGVEVKESVESNILANTVPKLVPSFERLAQIHAKNDVMKAPVLGRHSDQLQSDPRWFYVDASAATSETDYDNILIEEDEQGHPSPECTGSGDICEFQLNVAPLLALYPSYQFEGKSISQLQNDGAVYMNLSKESL